MYGLHRAIDNFINRKAIRACEADMTEAELDLFRGLLKSNRYRDAYAAVLAQRNQSTGFRAAWHATEAKVEKAIHDVFGGRGTIHDAHRKR